MEIYFFCQRVFWCQDLKMRHDFLGIQIWDLTFKNRYFWNMLETNCHQRLSMLGKIHLKGAILYT